jgi:hypothetical protein
MLQEQCAEHQRNINDQELLLAQVEREQKALVG